MRDLSDVTVRPSDFETLAQLCANDADFPIDFEGWQVMLLTAQRDAITRHFYPAPLLLDVREFAAWCERLRVTPCLDALRAFVIIKRREVS